MLHQIIGQFDNTALADIGSLISLDDLFINEM